ncbi:hypothetical protein ACU62B_17885 [Klebsiella aerogenes]
MTNNQLTPETVTRYAQYGADMMEWPDGRYVKYEDYAALAAELQECHKTNKPPVHPTVASEKLDDETLQELIEFRRTTFEYHSKEGNKVQTIIHGVTLSALRELQERRKAAMDSEPVAYIIQDRYEREGGVEGHLSRSHVSKYVSQEDINEHEIICTPLFKAPSLTHSIPDEWTFQNTQRYREDTGRQDAWPAMWGWNACRAAMLQAGNSPVIPDGYVMVPKEPTERMVIDGFESEPDETFSEPEIWEAYQKMSGCEQAAFRARLCWAAMLAAIPPAPTQENI